MKRLIIAKTSGFCFGVRRAVQMAERLGREGKHACTLGPIIHNAHVVGYLAKLGVPSVDSVAKIPSGHLAVIRSHGVPDSVYRELSDYDIPYLDATCPYVEKIHQIVRENAAVGKQVVIIGAKLHPEVLGIAGQCEKPLVFENENDLKTELKQMIPDPKTPLCVVAQTTIDRFFWNQCVEFIKKEYTNSEIFDTICLATSKRQREAELIAEQADAMVVIGDKTSSNTKALVAICKSRCDRVYHIESAAELPDLEDAAVVGVTAGASTPDWIIKEVEEKMSDEIKNVEIMEGESFEELLNQSFKTLNTGEKVVGVVTAITPTEVYVDLGTKHAGFLPIAEISDDPSVKAEDLFKVGDEVEAYVVRVNDVEGVITLSKRRLDALKSWDDIEVACEEKTIVEGTVMDVNKGGIVVSVKGARVFVPASQSGMPKDSDLTQMMKKKVRLRITEINRQRKRVVGSIRSVQYEERRAQMDKIWSEIEVGKIYQGVVKSLASYGAFIDIGGVDGMLHISEMSWKRIGHPSELFKVGDEVETFVLALDPEKKKISLGYKKAEDNPWVQFTTKYKVGDIASVKIVKLMPFGAFAEVLPGVDGLIHISQIADRRIGRPDEVLSEGQIVDAKITDIDMEKKKISLSIRALLEPEVSSEAASEAQPMEEDTVVASSDANETVISPELETNEQGE